MSTPAAARAWETHAAFYKRIWKSNLLSSFVQPLMYLGGMGLGIGALIDRNDGSATTLGGISYVTFIAPAMLATTAMMISSTESLWPIMDGFVWSRSFERQVTAPLGVDAILGGLVMWWATRIAIAAAAIVIVLSAFPDTRSWGLLPGVPFAVLTGLAFALPLSAFAAVQQTDVRFPAVQRMVIMPLFLFAGAFYPVSQLPVAMRWVAYVSPLWHGIELCRRSAMHTLGLTRAVGHVGVLLAYCVVGWVVARRKFDRRLQP